MGQAGCCIKTSELQEPSVTIPIQKIQKANLDVVLSSSVSFHKLQLCRAVNFDVESGGTFSGGYASLKSRFQSGSPQTKNAVCISDHQIYDSSAPLNHINPSTLQSKLTPQKLHYDGPRSSLSLQRNGKEETGVKKTQHTDLMVSPGFQKRHSRQFEIFKRLKDAEEPDTEGNHSGSPKTSPSKGELQNKPRPRLSRFILKPDRSQPQDSEAEQLQSIISATRVHDDCLRKSSTKEQKRTCDIDFRLTPLSPPAKPHGPEFCFTNAMVANYNQKSPIGSLPKKMQRSSNSELIEIHLLEGLKEGPYKSNWKEKPRQRTAQDDPRSPQSSCKDLKREVQSGKGMKRSSSLRVSPPLAVASKPHAIVHGPSPTQQSDRKQFPKKATENSLSEHATPKITSWDADKLSKSKTGGSTLWRNKLSIFAREASPDKNPFQPDGAPRPLTLPLEESPKSNILPVIRVQGPLSYNCSSVKTSQISNHSSTSLQKPYHAKHSSPVVSSPYHQHFAQQQSSSSIQESNCMDENSAEQRCQPEKGKDIDFHSSSEKPNADYRSQQSKPSNALEHGNRSDIVEL